MRSSRCVTPAQTVGSHPPCWTRAAKCSCTATHNFCLSSDDGFETFPLARPRPRMKSTAILESCPEKWKTRSVHVPEGCRCEKIFLAEWTLLRCCCKLRIWRRMSFKSAAAASERGMAENTCFGCRILNWHTLVCAPRFARATRIA